MNEHSTDYSGRYARFLKSYRRRKKIRSIALVAVCLFSSADILFSEFTESSVNSASAATGSVDASIPLPAENGRAEKLRVELSDEERAYLQKVSPIRFTGDPNWLPYEAFTEEGEYIGQVADHLKLIERLLDIKFEIIPSKTWSHALEMSRNKEVDVLSEVDSSTLGGGYPFTRTYSSSPVVIVMKEDIYFVKSLSEIEHKSIGIIRDYGNMHLVQEKFPNIQFKIEETLQEGLINVSSGSLDALLINSAQAIFYIKRLGLSNIKIAGQTEFNMRLAFAINPDKKRLVPIFNKALDAIYLSEAQKDIYNKWENVEVASQIDYALIYRILFFVFVIGAIILIYTFRLRSEISIRKALADELSASKELANSANEAKSRFLATMSHELRTPLHGVLGMLELLENTKLDYDQKRIVSTTRESSETLLNLLNEILDFSKIEAKHLEIHLEPCSLADLIEKCINNQVQRAYKKNLEIQLFIAPELRQKIYIDPLRVRQVVNNFLSNAIKFTQEGSIIITAMCDTRETTIDFVFEVEDTGIGISEDDQRKLFQEFVQVDNSSQRQAGGTGLGLSISRRLIEMMGGTVELESKVGEGTRIRYLQHAKRFTKEDTQKVREKWSGLRAAIVCNNNFIAYSLRKNLHYFSAHSDMLKQREVSSIQSQIEENGIQLLFIDDDILGQEHEKFSCKLVRLVVEQNLSASNPLAKVGILNVNPLQPRSLEFQVDVFLGLEPQEQFESSPQNVDVPEKKLSLLVVEDHPTNQELIKRQLQSLGYRFSIAGNGVDAWRLLKEREFDAILTDCHMPEMDGYTLAAKVRENFSQTMPIIAMTANAMSGEREKCLAAGMNDMLIKPTNLATLAACLNRWKPSQDTNESDSQNLDKVLGVLESRFNGRENLLPMLTSYWQATEKDIDDLKRAHGGDDFSTMRLCTHRIRGAARIVLADQIAEIAQQIEELAGADSPDAKELAALIRQLGRALQQHKTQALNKIT